MVIENLPSPFFEWLLGPDWQQGHFFCWPCVAVSVVLAVLAIWWLVAALRKRPDPAPAARMTIRVLAAGFVIVTSILLLVAATWYLDWGASRSVLGPVVEPTLAFLGWLLGPQWYQGAVCLWLLVVAGLTLGVLLVGWLAAAVLYGPVAGSRRIEGLLASAAVDLAAMSPRRVFALGWLAFKESIRRRVVVVFAVFVLILLFALWFLDPTSSRPAELCLSFVLTASTYLVLALALLLSTLSLPADIKNKTLHTVVTKPVRSSEIVLGRMLGFAAIGTCMLVVMGLVSYVFVRQVVSHAHKLVEADLQVVGSAGPDQAAPREGHTSWDHNHRHNVFIDASGEGRVEMQQGHWHDLSIEKSADKTVYTVGPPRGLLIARVPIYGKLSFKDSAGNDVERGINVGDEWTYRSFIQGGSLAAAVWTFKGITEDDFPEAQFPDGIPLEVNIEVFRTYKGDTSDPEKIPPVLGSLALRSPKSGAKPIEVRIFPAKDFETDLHYIPRQVETAEGRRLDLFAEVAVDGRLEVWLRCVEPAQYFGCAQADLYFRARDAYFALNLAKGYFGVWLQMLLVIGIGVTLSTLLSGPIALVTALGALAPRLLFPAGLLEQLASGKAVGGGPMEAFIRLITQQNVVSDMEPGMRTRLAQMTDNVLEYGLWAASKVLPDFGRLSFADWVAHGFDISGNMVVQCALCTLAYLLPVFIAGYLFLKTREVAR